MNRWICGLHRVWARARKKEPLFLAAAALLFFFLNEPWVLWGGLLLGALDAYQLDLEKRQGAPLILGRVPVMLLTALFASPHSYPLALPGAVFWMLLFILWGAHLLFWESRELAKRGPSILFPFFLGTALFLNQLDADGGAFEAALLMGGYGLFRALWEMKKAVQRKCRLLFLFYFASIGLILGLFYVSFIWMAGDPIYLLLWLFALGTLYWIFPSL